MSALTERRVPIAHFSLTLLTLSVFVQTTQFAFLDVDDPSYVADNPAVRAGLTSDSIAWAWTASTLGHWHPVTYVSYIADIGLYGLNPGGFHFTNVVIHVANTLLLFLLLHKLTGAFGRSVFVAAIFGVHPLHVESVAWIAERKDLLSAFFAFLSLLAYHAWTCKRGWHRYGMAVFCFALGVMSKAIIVTLPCAMLLLDYWPLGRIQWKIARGRLRTFARLVVEKLPFFAVSAIGSYMTVWASVEDQAVRDLGELSPGYRLANACVSYATYMRQTIWPKDLAAFYPHLLDALPAWWVALSAVVLIGCTIIAGALTRRRPYLVVGWLWFLGLIVPVSGLFQVGDQAMADRYTYLALVGLLICVTWGAADLMSRSRTGAKWRGPGVAAIVLVVAFLGWRQTRYWSDTVPLYEHTLAVTRDNGVVRQILGNAYLRRGDGERAEGHFVRALELYPDHAEWLDKLGYAQYLQGKRDEARLQFQRALALDPNHADAHNNLGVIALEDSAFELAAEHFLEVVRIRPGYEGPYVNVGIALGALKRFDEARPYFEIALEIDPNSARAHFNFGAMLVEQGRFDEALAHLEFATRANPADSSALEYLNRARAGLPQKDQL